jgi:hypothetical protein
MDTDDEANRSSFATLNCGCTIKLKYLFPLNGTEISKLTAGYRLPFARWQNRIFSVAKVMVALLVMGPSKVLLIDRNRSLPCD